MVARSARCRPCGRRRRTAVPVWSRCGLAVVVRRRTAAATTMARVGYGSFRPGPEYVQGHSEARSSGRLKAGDVRARVASHEHARPPVSAAPACATAASRRARARLAVALDAPAPYRSRRSLRASQPRRATSECRPFRPLRDADDVTVRIAVRSDSPPRFVVRQRRYLRARRDGVAMRKVKVVNVEAQLERPRLGPRRRREQGEVQVLAVRPRVLAVRFLAQAASFSHRNTDRLAVEPSRHVEIAYAEGYKDEAYAEARGAVVRQSWAASKHATRFRISPIPPS